LTRNFKNSKMSAIDNNWDKCLNRSKPIDKTWKHGEITGPWDFELSRGWRFILWCSGIWHHDPGRLLQTFQNQYVPPKSY
jgi:hypothetical protein